MMRNPSEGKKLFLGEIPFMKKCFVVLSACALMASGVALAEDQVKTASSNVEVQLTGDVVETPCTITVGNAGTVDLGQIKKAANKKGTVTPIPFRLSECGSYDKVTFHWNTPTIAKLDEQGRLGTNINGVYVSFYTDAAGTVPVKMETAPIGSEDNFGAVNQDGTHGEVILHTPYYAQLVTGDNAPEQAGPVNATMAFKVDFDYK